MVDLNKLNDESHTIDSSDLQIALAEYADLRDEIKRRIEDRTHLTELMIGIVATIGTIALYLENLFILIFMILSTLFFLQEIKSSYIIHANLTKYIREKVEQEKLQQLLSKENREKWTLWESYYYKLSKEKRGSASRRAMFNRFSFMIYVLSGLGITYQAKQEFGCNYSAAIFFIYLVVGGYFVYKTWMIDPYEST